MTDTPALLPLPISLDQLRACVDDLTREVGPLLSGRDDDQVNWLPGEGRGWSIAQCLDHLAITTNTYLDAIEAAVRTAPKRHEPAALPVVPGWFARWFIRQLEPPVKLRMPAPGKIVPAPRRSASEAERAFLASLDRYRSVLDAASSIDVNAVRFANPFAPIRFTVGAGLVVIVAHGRRHLWQARNVRAAADLPEGGLPPA
jgi:hypothetical protein